MPEQDANRNDALNEPEVRRGSHAAPRERSRASHAKRSSLNRVDGEHAQAEQTRGAQGTSQISWAQEDGANPVSRAASSAIEKPTQFERDGEPQASWARTGEKRPAEPRQARSKHAVASRENQARGDERQPSKAHARHLHSDAKSASHRIEAPRAASQHADAHGRYARQTAPVAAPIQEAGIAAEASARKAKGGSGSGKKKGGGVWRVIFWVSLVVFIGAIVALGAYLFSYWQSQNAYENLAEDVLGLEDIGDVPLANIDVNWDELLKRNPDTVAWIVVPGTIVNYPVVKGTDNDYYLKRAFDKSEGRLVSAGTLFMDYRNASDMSDQLNVIYGHNMADGSMFAFIRHFLEDDNSQKQRLVYILTPNGNYKCRVCAHIHVSAYDTSIVRQNFNTPSELQSYVQDKISNGNVHYTDIAPVADMSKIFALLTCDGRQVDKSGRYLMLCYVEESSVGVANADDAGGDGADAGSGAHLAIN